MQPVTVKVITYAPTVFRHCQHCEVAFEGIGLGERIHRSEARDALPDDLAEDFQRVSDWVHGLLARHAGRVTVSVIDAASIEGVWASLRHGVRRYPAVIFGDGVKRSGTTDFAELDALVDARLRNGGAGARGGEGNA